jgi:hypothetical protein
MSGGGFIPLKAGGARPESAKQAEIRLANLLKILSIGGFGGQSPWPGRNRCIIAISARFLPDMANLPVIAGFVIQITIWTQNSVQYAVSHYREKISRITGSASIH